MTRARGGDENKGRVDIRTAQPGIVMRHHGAEADRIRADLEELTGGPVPAEHPVGTWPAGDGRRRRGALAPGAMQASVPSRGGCA